MAAGTLRAMFTEQRADPREPLTISLQIGEHTAVTRDISASGMYLEISGCHALRGAVLFEMGLTGACIRFCAEGEIVRIEHAHGKTGIAVRLLSAQLLPVP
jgi:hypothetical protein